MKRSSKVSVPDLVPSGQVETSTDRLYQCTCGELITVGVVDATIRRGELVATITATHAPILIEGEPQVLSTACEDYLALARIHYEGAIFEIAHILVPRAKRRWRRRQ